MREIKFRGRDESGSFVYGDLIQDLESRRILEHSDIGGMGTLADPETVGQFTGLKDRDDVEIYEGDIIEFTVYDAYGGDTQYISKIVWDDEECAFMLMLIDTTSRHDYWNLGWVKLQDDELKIVGNIHENPELLK